MARNPNRRSRKPRESGRWIWEKALDGVAERHGVLLLPAEVVLAGAPDYTGQVREAMAAWERALAEPGAAADEHGAGQPEDRR